MIPEKMKALVVTDVRKVEVREVSTPVPMPGEILVKLEKALICTWEQRIFTGQDVKPPFVPGHEISGVVAEIPEGTYTELEVGDPVIVKTYDSCGQCEFCYRGMDNLCKSKSKKRFYDGIPGAGGMAQYIAIASNRVFALNKDANLETAAFAEPLSCCLHSMEQADIEFGEDVVIVGGGIMGQLHSLLAQKRGARVILVELDEARREMAKNMGAHVVINPAEVDAFEEIRRLTGGRGAHVIFYTINVVKLARDYQDVLANRGRLIYYGSYHPSGEIAIDPNHIHYSEKLLTGSYSPTVKGFWQATQLLGNNLIDVSPFISAKFGIEDSQTAFERALDMDTYRVLIDLWH
ncbi:MAG: alcohol dehydrogenase catalytic domain-containing protein [Lachnospiraceae bacterium]|nr:alcohol dehydrogenase catalytic domain-containing protein [Lachnospiraceae bacterium]